jgi:hypothetical protein
MRESYILNELDVWEILSNLLYIISGIDDLGLDLEFLVKALRKTT